MSASIPLEDVAQPDQSRQPDTRTFGLINSLEQGDARDVSQHTKPTPHLVDRAQYQDAPGDEEYAPGQQGSEAQTLLEHRSSTSQHLRASKEDRVNVLGVSVSFGSSVRFNQN